MEGEHMRPLSWLERCGGYYECPKDPSGKRIGPLVGYADRDENGKQLVGDTYNNFATIERSGQAFCLVSAELRDLVLRKVGPKRFSGFCGAPEGGRNLAFGMASTDRWNFRCIYPVKKVVREATKDSKEISRLSFGRHTPHEEENLILVEDVCHKFSTIRELIQLVQVYGAKVVAIACFLDGSAHGTDFYKYDDETLIPVISLAQRPILDYRQDDPEVVKEITDHCVVFEPKSAWSTLMRFMEEVKTT